MQIQVYQAQVFPTSGEDLSLWQLFLEADVVVKAVIFLLIFASIWSWAIIFDKIRLIRQQNRLADQFEDQFWSGGTLDRLYTHTTSDPDASAGIMARVFAAAMGEWNRRGEMKPSASVSAAGLQSLSQRIERSMAVASARELAVLEKGMTFLASVGSVAPFVGLFGTVWGIMNSFQAIAQSKNTSLAVVAPGIAEALFATALGLLVAIPAVVAYNRFSAQIDGVANRIDAFASEFATLLSRQMEEG